MTAASLRSWTATVNPPSTSMEQGHALSASPASFCLVLGLLDVARFIVHTRLKRGTKRPRRTPISERRSCSPTHAGLCGSEGTVCLGTPPDVGDEILGARVRVGL